MLLSPIFLALGAVATSVLNAAGRFAASAIAPIVYNLAIIGAALILAPTSGSTGSRSASSPGRSAHLLVQIRPLGPARVPLRAADRPLRRRRRGEALALMAPRAIGLGVTQITFVVMTALASRSGAGAVTAFNVAFSLLQIPLGVIGVPLGHRRLAVALARAAVGRTGALRGPLPGPSGCSSFVMLPITALGIVLRVRLVELLFGYGRFDQAASTHRADTLPRSCRADRPRAIAVLARAFYARQDTRRRSSPRSLRSRQPPWSRIARRTARAAGDRPRDRGRRLERGDPPRDPAGPVAAAIRAPPDPVVGRADADRRDRRIAGRGRRRGRPDAGPGRRPRRGFGLVIRMTIVSIVWLLTSAGLASVLRITELPAIIALMLDIVRRPRGA